MSLDNSIYQIVSGGASPLRRPRARLLVGGQTLDIEDLSVTQNNHFHADAFEIRLPLGNGVFTEDYWFEQPPGFSAIIQAGFEDDSGNVSWVTLLDGIIDEPETDDLTGMLTLKGRDRTALFIDHKTEQSFKNLTSSEIVTQLAQARGLTADVVATKTDVGTYYAQDHTNLHLGQFSHAITEWDLIVYLAGKEGFNAWVTGTTLHFRPEDEGQSDPYLVYRAPSTVSRRLSRAANATVTNMRIRHSPTAAKDILVEVRTAHTGRKSAFTAKSGSSSKDATVYSFIKPNMSVAEAQTYADTIHDQLSAHEYTLEWDQPADLNLQPRRFVKLTGGNGIVYNHSYWVDSVELRMNINDGFVMFVKAKNHPSSNQALI